MNESQIQSTESRRLRTEIKATILDFDANGSYIEEDDKSYIYNSSSIEIDETMDDDEDDDDDDDDDIDTLDDDLDDTEVELDEDDNDVINPKLHQQSQHESILQDTNSIVQEAKEKSSHPSPFRLFLIKHEIPRKAFHSSIGILTLWLYTLGVTIPQLFLPLSTIFIVVLTNDVIRLHYPEINKIVCKFMWFIIRESEVNSYNGVLYYLAGVLIVFYFFPKDIAVLSVLLLSWADTAASTFGRQFGKYTPKLGAGKSLAGSLASAVTGSLATYLFYGYFIPQYSHLNSPTDIFWTQNTSMMNLHVYAILCGLITSFAEFINLWGLDDNFTIPVLGGTCLYWLVRAAQI